MGYWKSRNDEKYIFNYIIYYQISKNVAIEVHFSTGTMMMVKGSNYKDWVENEFKKLKNILRIKDAYQKTTKRERDKNNNKIFGKFKPRRFQ